MKTLILSVDHPLPEDKGSRMRTMHFVRFFKERGEVDLMCYRSQLPSEPLPSPSPFRKEFYLEIGCSCQDRCDNILQTLRSKLVGGKPWVVENFGPETVQYVQEVITTEQYDIILCRYSLNAYPLLGLPPQYRERVLLDVDDLMSSELYDAMHGAMHGMDRIKAAIDKAVFRRYQLRCLELGRVLLCSEDDRAKISHRAAGGRLFVVPNIIPKKAVPASYRRSGYRNRSLLFVGALSYQPNEAGILWFINEIFKKLPEELKDLRLQVVGKDPREKLKAAVAGNARIQLVENPPDVLPYYESCHALVVPVLVGGGTRIKILEAGKFLRPVFSTVKGAYGLGLEDGENVVHFSDRQNFITKFNWLQDEENYRRVTDSLGRVVERSYSEEIFMQRMESVMKTM